jgi:adenosylcobyric acid synthase
MLGKDLIDAGYESAAGTYAGLGLLDCSTRFISYTKTTTQVTRKAYNILPILSGMSEVSGYEIHMGETVGSGTDREAFAGDGRASEDGLVFGTYMHGLFQNISAANALLSYLYRKKGIAFDPITVYDADPYDRLADLFEEHVDMDSVERILRGAR